jgi:hypothetical protein
MVSASTGVLTAAVRKGGRGSHTVSIYVAHTDTLKSYTG